jgi:hypothetical protein
VLGLGMDEMNEDEDAHITVSNVPFIAEKDFLLKYGTSYALTMNEQKEVVLTPLGNSPA